jgi:zinc transporter ZupT
MDALTIRSTIILPILLIIALIAAFLAGKPFDYLTKEVPPAEAVAVESVRLDGSGIHVTVRGSSAKPTVIAQVQVDGAYRSFSITPGHSVGYLKSATIHIPYHWITGETHHLAFVTATGVTIKHTIDVAVATPRLTFGSFAGFALIGLFVGIVPVIIGYTFYPALLSFGERGRDFALALTVGLLSFLLVDTLGEGLEVAGKAAKGLHADLIIWLSALLSCLVLLGIGRRGGKPPVGAALALFIAIGIGVHNFGEGLAIGASFAVGEIALASFLVLGFALHNVTEGIAIAAPIRKDALSIVNLAFLALVAGGPAIPGTMLGALSISPFWTALAFGIGAGAILQVIIEVGNLLLRRQGDGVLSWQSVASLSGFACGIAIMYLTAFLTHG